MTTVSTEATLGDPLTTIGDMVVRVGKVFECGNYPHESFSLTPEEADAAIAGFSGADIDLEHMPSVLDGKLGRVQSLKRVGTDIIGTTVIPKWLDDALPEKKVSATWRKQDKTFTGLALVRKPHVTDAALFAAFAKHDTPSGQACMQMVHDMCASSGAKCVKPEASFHSSHEITALQEMHDTAVKHGATCNSTTQEQSYFSDHKIEEKPMATQEEIGAWFSGLIHGSKPATTETTVTVPVTDNGDTAKFKAQAEAAEAELARFRAERIDTDAKAFAASLVTEGKAVPAEVPGIVAAFKTTAADDASNPTLATFSSGTETKTGSRIDAFKAMFEARPKHNLTGEVIQDAQFSVKPTETGEPDPAAIEKRRVELLSMTPIGQAALK